MQKGTSKRRVRLQQLGSCTPEIVMFVNCIDLTWQTTLLALDARAVIDLRLRKLRNGGPAAWVEAHHMVLEKMAALAEATATLLGGGTAPDIIRQYRQHVQANELRLTELAR